MGSRIQELGCRGNPQVDFDIRAKCGHHQLHAFTTTGVRKFRRAVKIMHTGSRIKVARLDAGSRDDACQIYFNILHIQCCT